MDLALKSVEAYRALWRLIATFAIANDTALLHNDRDFDPFEAHLGLHVVR